jgi:hypothetical protein
MAEKRKEKKSLFSIFKWQKREKEKNPYSQNLLFKTRKEKRYKRGNFLGDKKGVIYLPNYKIYLPSCLNFL